ncbi:MAG: C25 family peptidase propeptide domain-containing protein, partial [Anaerolineae bacterium]
MKLFSLVVLITSLLLPTLSSAAPQTSALSATIRRSADTADHAPTSVRVLSTDDTALVLALDTPDYQVTRIETAQGAFDAIQVAGYASSQEPGQPQLPMQGALLAIPPGAQVTAEVISSDGQLLPQRLDLLPTPRQVVFTMDPAAQAAADASGMPSKPVFVYERSRTTASGDDLFPAQLVHVGEVA